ncbi:MAG: SAM-dependent methyltransferase [Solobacterium sp.]|nr:SAM-dependent methyltransferase [Solobacterium sp.]
MNKRLKAIEQLVPKDRITADIGTDHAYLPIQLVKTGKCSKVYACDIRRGPLAIAEENIRNAGYTRHIPVILSDGFEYVPMDTDCVVIAGMGVYTGVGILEKALNRLSLLKEIIVQVNDDVPVLRKWISDHGYTILEEDIVTDKKHTYMIVVFSADDHSGYSEEEILFGPVLLQKKDPVFQQYWQARKQFLEQVLPMKKPAEKPAVVKEIEMIAGMLES